MSENLILFDVDGTIITEDNYIPASAVSAIRAAQQAGNLCFVNTGRPYSHIVPTVKEIGFSGYICSCGQHIVMDGNVVLHTGFDAAQSQAILQELTACGLEAVFESEEGVRYLTDGHPNPDLAQSKQHYSQLGFPIHISPWQPGYRFDKFCVWPRPDCDLPRFLNWIAPLCEIIFRENNFIELVKKGCSKKTGIEYVMGKTGIPAARCYAIGDSTNDLPMFSCVGHSIVMGNAPSEVKQHGDFVTTPLLEDGIALALSHYGLTAELS